MTDVVLVKCWKGNSRGLPKGKINQGEPGFDAALREVRSILVLRTYYVIYVIHTVYTSVVVSSVEKVGLFALPGALGPHAAKTATALAVRVHMRIVCICLSISP